MICYLKIKYTHLKKLNSIFFENDGDHGFLIFKIIKQKWKWLKIWKYFGKSKY